MEIYYTDNEGKGYLSINGENDGDYKVIISYDGNNKYNGCTAEQTITSEDGTSTNTKNTTSNSTASTSKYNNASSSSSNGKLYYDARYNFYYNDNGIVVGGQNNGMKVYDLLNFYRNQEKNNSTDLQ